MASTPRGSSEHTRTAGNGGEQRDRQARRKPTTSTPTPPQAHGVRREDDQHGDGTWAHAAPARPPWVTPSVHRRHHRDQPDHLDDQHGAGGSCSDQEGREAGRARRVQAAEDREAGRARPPHPTSARRTRRRPVGAASVDRMSPVNTATVPTGAAQRTRAVAACPSGLDAREGGQRDRRGSTCPMAVIGQEEMLNAST